MSDNAADRRRVILLGASNLTLAFPLVVETLRATLGPVELYAAHGHGRSYGMTSRVLARTLPGILNCGLWSDLAGRPRPARTPLAVVTDIGNDLLYGAGAPQIAEWVEACLERLHGEGATVVITQLPLESVLRLGPARYAATKALFFPGKGPVWDRMRPLAAELDQTLAELGQKWGAICVRPRPEWYGIDPIHVRRRLRPHAWGEYLSPLLPPANPPQVTQSRFLTALAYWRLRPASRCLFGLTQLRSQPVFVGKDGTTIALY